jgi:uncharacterized delta-60 repeat protein
VVSVYSIALQTDGKILITGDSSMFRCATVRLNTNGTLDPTFNGNGRVETGVGPACFARAVKAQTDGKIVVGGYSNTTDQQGFAVTAMLTIRYNSDGSLDSSYGTTGKTLTAYENHYYSGGVTLQIQPDGKIIQSVNRLYQDVSLDGDICLIRYNPNGTFDSSFGSGGFAVAVTPPDHEIIADTALLPDGKILVVSSRADGTTLTRFNNDGSLDNAFGTSGFVVNSGVANVDQGGALRVQPDGKILVGGSASVGGVENFAVTRYNADGSLDTSRPAPAKLRAFRADGTESTFWGSSGTIAFSFNAATGSSIHSMKFDTTGRLVTAGRVHPLTGGDSFLGLARLQSEAPLYAGVYGTIRTAGGMPIKNVVVVLSEGDLSAPRYALTNQFGAYFFSDLPVTENYSVSISSKRFNFSTDQRHVMLNQTMENIDFIAEP